MEATFVLFILIIQYGTQMSPSSAAKPIPNNTEFIKTSCSYTTYPNLCFSSLSTYATKIKTSPKLLATTALSVTLEAARSATTFMTKISKDEQGSRTSREAESLLDCVEELKDSVDELQKSLAQMGGVRAGQSFGIKMNDIETWVSSALTDYDTCLDGLSENGVNGSVIKNQIVGVSHLTSNALALIHNYGSSQKMVPKV